jgi:hypothetical protein
MLRSFFFAPSALLFSLLVGLGCGSPDPAPLDASPLDASIPADAQTGRDAAIDAGPTADGGAVDAPIALDAPGEIDAQTPPDDASAPGSGSCDTRRVACRSLPPRPARAQPARALHCRRA